MLPGLGVILLVLPLQYFFGYKIIRIKMQCAKHAAERSGTLQEVLPAIKLIKYYAWCVLGRPRAWISIGRACEGRRVI
jgi:hypothetical protein